MRELPSPGELGVFAGQEQWPYFRLALTPSLRSAWGRGFHSRSWRAVRSDRPAPQPFVPRLSWGQMVRL
jgi:hypothetical protein